MFMRNSLLCIAAAMPMTANAQSAIPDVSLSTMANCMWGVTATEEADIERQLAFGVDVASKLGRYCGDASGLLWNCERSGGTPGRCASQARSMAQEHINNLLNR